MAQGLLLWSPCLLHSYSLRFIPFKPHNTKLITLSISATLDSQNETTQELTARERRRLRNEKRESKMGNNWREEVEEKLLKKPKKRYATWTEELNLDTLANSGPQWWVVRVSRLRGHETADLIARLLARNFPQLPFKVYAPAVQVKRKLKNGSISVKPKPLFPGCVFIKCIMNKEIHDFIRECEGVGGFIGSKVGNTKRQINKPRPVSEIDMEAIFKKSKEEQEKYEQEFKEQQKQEEILNSSLPNAESQSDSVPKRRSKKASDPLKLLTPGSTVKVLSGDFAEFEGCLKKVNRKTKKVTVGFTLFGKESLVDLDANEIVATTT
ncbi:hypothetical protein CsatA_022702 [Cannabis sativa]